MIEFQVEIIIQRPVYEVFAFVADLENLPYWDYYVIAILKTSYGAVKAASTFHQTRKTGAQDLIITTFKRDKALVYETIPPSTPDSRRSMLFQEEGSGTRIIDTWEVDTGQPGFLQKITGAMMRKAVKESLVKLKILLETGEVTLQDGRRVTI